MRHLACVAANAGVAVTLRSVMATIPMVTIAMNLFLPRQYSLLMLRVRAIATMSMLAALMSFSAEPARSQAQSVDSEATVEAIVKNYLAKHPEEIERIVRDYLVKHPEVVQASIAQLLLRRAAINAKAGMTGADVAADKASVIKGNASVLFNSSRQVTLGNPEGDVTVVEFFDYNCGFCRRALADTQALLQTDPKLKIVLKELPLLGLPSSEAARVAVAVHMQDPAGDKYLAFHQTLLASRGRVDKDRALEVARELGLDMRRLEQDMASGEASATLEENARLARELGINGTPGYIVGDKVVLGAVGVAVLKDKILAARK